MAEPSLELLHVMVQRVLDRLDEHSDDFKEVRRRFSALKRAELGIRGDLIGDAQVDATLQQQIDRIRSRVDRVEQRLDITG